MGERISMTDTNEVPKEAQEQLRSAVDTALAKPNQAQGFLSNIPDLSAAGGAKDKILGVVDTVLGALDTIQQYSWLIPAKYVDGVQKFEDALRKVRGWLD
jgi:hypothetical protein